MLTAFLISTAERIVLLTLVPDLKYFCLDWSVSALYRTHCTDLVRMCLISQIAQKGEPSARFNSEIKESGFAAFQVPDCDANVVEDGNPNMKKSGMLKRVKSSASEQED